jgi:hypothetical protein
VQFNPNSLSAKEMETRLNEMISQTDGIIEFLKSKHVRLDKYILFLKLAAKQSLLFTCDKKSFQRWLRIYPESNKYIWFYPSLPLHLRIVGGCTSLRLWLLVDIWIQAKKWYLSHAGVKTQGNI